VAFIGLRIDSWSLCLTLAECHFYTANGCVKSLKSNSLPADSARFVHCAIHAFVVPKYMV